MGKKVFTPPLSLFDLFFGYRGPRNVDGGWRAVSGRLSSVKRMQAT